MRELNGRVALVTGAARRVGREIALHCANAGMDVAFTYHRSEQDAATLVEAIESKGLKALGIQQDNADNDAAARTITAFRSRFDRLDLLVNNASCFSASPMGKVTPAQFDENIAVNARTPFFLMQDLAELLAANYVDGDRTTTGRIVNFIDIHILGEPLRHFLAYNVSKAALLEATMTCALEFAPKITVNAIAPGVIDWADFYTNDVKTDYLKRVPLARAGTPRDAAEAVLYFARDAHYCTGQVLQLDGGRHLT